MMFIFKLIPFVQSVCVNSILYAYATVYILGVDPADSCRPQRKIVNSDRGAWIKMLCNDRDR